MAQTWLISGPPGCGKTTWMLNALSSHQGPRGYLRLAGVSTAGLEQAVDGGIDLTYLQDQITDLIDLSTGDQASSRQEEQLNLVDSGVTAIDRHAFKFVPSIAAMDLVGFWLRRAA